jgi:integrase/recombinase XerD
MRIEHINGMERGHRTLSLVGKGRKSATIPLAVPVARFLDAAAGDRTEGWLILRADGTKMDRRSAARVVVRLAKQVGIRKRLSPHVSGTPVTACLDAGVPLRDVQIAARHSDPRMTIRYDRARGNLDRHAKYVVGTSSSTTTGPTGYPESARPARRPPPSARRSSPLRCVTPPR